MPAYAGIDFPAGHRPAFGAGEWPATYKAAVLADGPTWMPAYAGMTTFFLAARVASRVLKPDISFFPGQQCACAGMTTFLLRAALRQALREFPG